MTKASLRPLDEADRSRLLIWRASPQVSAFMRSAAGGDCVVRAYPET